MRRYLPLIGMLLCLFVVGWSLWPANRVQVEAVVFAHPDEMVKGEGFIVLADRRIFAVMAFLNAVGYDEEAKGQKMHPVRVRVRKMVESNLTKSPEKLQAWRKYYKDKRIAGFIYQDFALSLNADYPFRRIRPDDELGYPQTARQLRDFPDVLNNFWVIAELAKVWSEVKPDYIAEIKKYNFETMKHQLSFLWEYLRMKRSDTYILVNIPNLLESHYIGIGARYENYYYSVESPGSHSYALNIHEYLHSIVNPIVKTHYDKYKGKLLDYCKAGKDGWLSKTYQEPTIFTYECLVRALDHRLEVKLEEDPSLKKGYEDRVAFETRNGLTLTQPFYLLLTDFEGSGKSFSEYLPLMLENLPKYTHQSDR